MAIFAIDEENGSQRFHRATFFAFDVGFRLPSRRHVHPRRSVTLMTIE
jgi:hypothetical protein